MLKTRSAPSRSSRASRPASWSNHSNRAAFRSPGAAVSTRPPRPAPSPRRLLDTLPDPYAVRRAPVGCMVCRECHAIYERKRWHFDEESYRRLVNGGYARPTACPACTRIRDRYPEGVLTLRWPGLAAHADEVMRLLRNAEARARGINPMERVMRLEAVGAEWRVTTTNNKLAQRMGRELQHAYHGEVHFQWSHRDRLVRVTWEREM